MPVSSSFRNSILLKKYIYWLEHHLPTSNGLKSRQTGIEQYFWGQESLPTKFDYLLVWQLIRPELKFIYF